MASTITHELKAAFDTLEEGSAGVRALISQDLDPISEAHNALLSFEQATRDAVTEVYKAGEYRHACLIAAAAGDAVRRPGEVQDDSATVARLAGVTAAAGLAIDLRPNDDDGDWVDLVSFNVSGHVVAADRAAISKGSAPFLRSVLTAHPIRDAGGRHVVFGNAAAFDTLVRWLDGGDVDVPTEWKVWSELRATAVHYGAFALVSILDANVPRT